MRTDIVYMVIESGWDGCTIHSASNNYNLALDAFYSVNDPWRDALYLNVYENGVFVRTIFTRPEPDYDLEWTDD